MIVFGGGKVVGTITRNEARGRTGCGDCARERTVAKERRLMPGTLQEDGKSGAGGWDGLRCTVCKDLGAPAEWLGEGGAVMPADGLGEKRERFLSGIYRTVERAAREGGIGWVRGMEIGVSGDRPEASEAGQLDGPVPREGTTRVPGPANC